MPASKRHRSRSNSFDRQKTLPMSEINVTPMVDVMLVLLVIFMVTAPLMTVGVQVDLPETTATAIQGEDEPIAVSVDSKGQIFLQETVIELQALATRLKAISGNNPEVRVFVRGDKAIHYGRVMEVMGALHSGGFIKVALITEPFEVKSPTEPNDLEKERSK